ncbi:periplasmic sensor signal transduction histidine kinase [Caballeronia pedi]|uniref:histidine kinase n=1 Tax=Caballeronia pedi TaxID=1777141 RepID=A0A158ABP2_9BURK|nr:ATP-binding protein [Caballeronia pedi]SAK55254.1 periplasmic sensor signal transduction histidine kinase [Caballeronia pedi]
MRPRLMPRVFSTTLGQILAIVACSSAATLLLFIALLFYPGAPPNPPWPWQTSYRIVALVDMLKAMPDAERAHVLSAGQRSNLMAKLTGKPSICVGSTLDTHDLESALRSILRIDAGLTVRTCDARDPTHDLQVLIPLDDRTLEIRTDRNEREPDRFTVPFFAALAFLCVGVAALSAWAVSRVIGPLRRLSENADAFGRDITVAPIVEEGPLEIRRAAHAFNRMQERIARSMQSRTRMLAAISHDLRTPLTRMRLQLDVEKKEIERAKLLRDVDLMQKMVSSALAFLTSDAGAEAKEWLDLGALLETLCDEYAESGVEIRYEGPDYLPFFCRPESIQRLLTNLLENAIHYGTQTLVTAGAIERTVLVEVIDNGPGIPADRLQDVVEPFVRLDPARSKRPGSVGLGLSIVDDIVRAHGGTLTLINRKPSGLIARVALPLAGDLATRN